MRWRSSFGIASIWKSVAEAPLRTKFIQFGTAQAPADRSATGKMPVSRLPGDARTGWREMLAAGLYQTGALRMLQGLSRSHELRSDARRSFPRWRKVSTAKFAILYYHRIGTEGIPYYSKLAPETFEAQMRYLRERYRVVSLEQLLRELGDPEATGQAVAVTFDDGYRDNYTQAFPILKTYGVPATIFLTVHCIETGEVAWYDRVFLALQALADEELHLELDGPRRFLISSPRARIRTATEIVSCLRRMPDQRRQQCCAALEKQVALPAVELADRMLTWEQVRQMYQAGIAFGSHTMTHPVVSWLAPAEAERELLESKRILEKRLGCPVQDFAYPFGQPADCGDAATALLARCGYRSAATTSCGIQTPGADLYRLRRVQFGEDCSLAMFAFKLNQLFFHVEEDTLGAAPAVESPALEAAADGPRGLGGES